jgi:type I restriction enzyme S subunit
MKLQTRLTAQQLKNSILQLAVQGKLVSQDANDEPASELLQRIRAERDAMDAAGDRPRRAKRDSEKFAEITDEEKPFDIPESWEWCRLIDCCKDIADIDHKMPQEQDKGIPYISPRDFTDKGIDYGSAKKISKEDFHALSKKVKPEKNDIIFPRYGTIGIVRLVEVDFDFLVSYSCCTIKTEKEKTNPKFIFFALQSPLIKEEIKKYINKTTQPNVGLQSIKMFLFPLPPLAEQKRIVEKIESLLPLIDNYDEAEQKLFALNEAFPDQLKKSILQYAVQGKLVAQDANDEPASELLKRIRAERDAMNAAGDRPRRVKRDSEKFEEITDEEKPFDIPESWAWCRLGDVGTWGSGATPSRTNAAYYKNGTIPWLKTGDLNDGSIKEIPEKITPLALEKTSVRLNPIGSVLIAMYGATIGKVGILSIEATTNQACCACISSKMVFNKYLFYFLISQRDKFRKQAEGGAQPNISKEKIVRFLFPLPPLAEQKRIVAKIEELMKIADRLN